MNFILSDDLIKLSLKLKTNNYIKYILLSFLNTVAANILFLLLKYLN